MAEELKKIGRRKYEALKQFDLEDLSEENIDLFEKEFKGLTIGQAISQIKDYETCNFDYGNMIENVNNYFDKLHEEKPKPDPIIITKEWLWNEFVKNYRNNEGVKFISNEDTVENIKPIVFYFLGDFENFKKCANVYKKTKLDIKKGLLLIGDNGNGKTSIMKAMQMTMAKTPVKFRTLTSNEVVSYYESCKDPQEKRRFSDEMNEGIKYFDDIISERQASNYGKIEIFKEILEERYSKNKRTHASMNYNYNHIGDIDKSLEQIADKYGNRMYDRVFSMFNIVEFKGKSFR